MFPTDRFFSQAIYDNIRQYTFFIYKTAKCVILPFILPRKTCLCLGGVFTLECFINSS